MNRSGLIDDTDFNRKQICSFGGIFLKKKISQIIIYNFHKVIIFPESKKFQRLRKN